MEMPNKNAAAQRTWALCRSLIDIGYHPVVVGLGNTNENNILNTFTTDEEMDFYCDCNPVTNMSKIKRMIRISQFVKVIDHYGKHTIKAVIAQEHESISLYRLKRYCRRNSLALVVDTFEWYEKSRWKFPIGLIKNIDTSLRMEAIYPTVDNMICISRYLYEHYRPYVKNIIMVPGTIVQTDKKWNKKNEYKKNEILTIGYAGSPGRKGEKERADWIVESVCKLNELGIPCRAFFVGGRAQSLIENFRPDLKGLPFYKKSIVYLGQKTHEECIEIISKCDFSVIAREDKRVTKAGFPTKLSESLGAGTPVITTPSSNISDFIVQGVNGIVVNECSCESLLEGIKKAFDIYSKEDMALIHQNVKYTNPLVHSNYNAELSNFFNRLVE